MASNTSSTISRECVAGIVMAHQAVQDTVLRHLPFWLLQCSDILIVVPMGDRLEIPAEFSDCVRVHSMIPNGGAYSESTNIRTHLALTRARRLFVHRYFLLFEYDSLCWGHIPKSIAPETGGVAATKWPNEKRSPIHPKTFKGSFYLHFPIMIERQAMDLLIAGMTAIPADAEHGYTDRFIGLAAETAAVPVTDWRAMGYSYSYENISRRPDRVLACIEAVKNGALFSHGIKDADSLNKILPHSQWHRQQGAS